MIEHTICSTCCYWTYYPQRKNGCCNAHTCEETSATHSCGEWKERSAPTVFMPLHRVLMDYCKSIADGFHLQPNAEELVATEYGRLMALHPEWVEPVQRCHEARRRRYEERQQEGT